MKILILLSVLLLLFGFFVSRLPFFTNDEIITGAPPYNAGDGNVPDDADFSWLSDWKRPEGPAKVALQVGHWKNEEVPDELHRLRGNTGATGGGKTEWEVNYEIAMQTKPILEARGVTVELLPATVPPQYFADVFVSIHADGSLDPSKSGYKAASPRRDYTGTADQLVTHIETAYEEATDLEKDPNVTRNMRGYYAFSWWRYEHAVHPMAAAAILETGFLTNASDRQLLINSPEVSAQGLANGILTYLKSQELL